MRFALTHQRQVLTVSDFEHYTLQFLSDVNDFDSLVELTFESATMRDDVVLSVMQSLFAPSTSPSTSMSSSALAAAPPLRRGVSDSSASELSSESDSRRGDSDSRRDMPPLVLLSHAKSVEVSDLLKQKVRHSRDLGVVRL